MDDQTRRELSRGHRIDITTIGRHSGAPRRIEIVFHNFDGRLYISGMPRADRKRAWLLNLEADPHFTFHLKGTHPVDLPATARIITDEAERRAVLVDVARAWNRDDVDTMVHDSPLIEVTLDELAA
jgi:deazaflavin-dependent oxidoreductase (nitroreductase family)